DMLVPEPLKYESSTTADGFSWSIVLPGARNETRCSPGATTSGLSSPKAVGPRLLKAETWSSETSGVAMSLTEPAVSRTGSLPGDAIVPAPGPAFPAGTTTTMPCAHAVRSARDNGSSSGGNGELESSGSSKTRTLNWLAEKSTSWIPARTCPSDVAPPASATLTDIRFASGATPR